MIKKETLAIFKWFLVFVGFALYYFLTLKGKTEGAEIYRLLNGLSQLAFFLSGYFILKTLTILLHNRMRALEKNQ